MSRHYRIEIEGGDTWDSAPGGQFDPNSLLVELDITVTAQDAAPTTGTVRIWGIGLQKISQAGPAYIGKCISVYGGMAAGLPLAKPQQFGLLSHGTINQVVGDWEGLNQSLALIFVPGGAPLASGGANPTPPRRNLVLNWLKGKPLDQALKAALKQGYPNAQIMMNLSQQIIAPSDQVGYYPSLQKLGYFIRRMSQQIVGGKYPGVNIDITSGSINVWDSGSGGGDFSKDDLIGFPVWIGQGMIAVKTVMRGDHRPGDQITLPQTWTNTTEAGAPACSYYDQSTAFQGTWTIQTIHHIGNSRAPTGDAWVSVFECSQDSPQSEAQSNSQCTQGVMYDQEQGSE